MWQGNEIKQNDSGLVVSNKLDAEFARIQLFEAAYNIKFDNLQYTDQTTVLDKTQDKLIVSPWTLWSVLDPLGVVVSGITVVTDHLSEQFFDGKYWLRSDIPIEYAGPVDTLDNTDDTFYVTVAQIKLYTAGYDTKYLHQDGSTPMESGYSPILDQDIATKKYVDDGITDLASGLLDNYIEFAPAAEGDTVFSAPLGANNFMVYVNGVLQRKIKFAYDATSITFHVPLDLDDEVTIYIGGGR